MSWSKINDIIELSSDYLGLIGFIASIITLLNSFKIQRIVSKAKSNSAFHYTKSKSLREINELITDFEKIKVNPQEDDLFSYFLRYKKIVEKLEYCCYHWSNKSKKTLEECKNFKLDLDKKIMNTKNITDKLDFNDIQKICTCSTSLLPILEREV